MFNFAVLIHLLNFFEIFRNHLNKCTKKYYFAFINLLQEIEIKIFIIYKSNFNYSIDIVWIIKVN